MTRREREAWIGPFVGSLERLLGDERRERDAAALAALRRGLTGHPGGRDVWVYARLRGAAPEHEEPALLVASLFALWHQGGRSADRCKRSLGGSFSSLRGKPESESVDKRFARLLDCHPDDLPVQLRRAISLLRRDEGIPIDWRQLLDDLLRWKAPRRPVQRKWARDYWKTRGLLLVGADAAVGEMPDDKTPQGDDSHDR